MSRINVSIGVSFLLSAAMLHSSCKETAKKERVAIADDTPKVQVERSASSTREIRAVESFYFSIWKTPHEKVLANLPESGKVPEDKIPYSGYWYPEKRTSYSNQEYDVNWKGGTHIGSPSPLEKYDQAFNGGQNKAVEWEIRNHTRAPDDPDADWAGHCNGFAAAAQRHSEPKTSVTEKNTTFSPRDIKALLAEIHMSAKFYILGGNRCDDQETQNKPIHRGQRVDPEVMGECEDVNPGSFHVAVTNWLGRQSHTIIFDRNYKDQVWNYPMYEYKVEEKRDNLTAAQVQSQYLQSAGANYKYNPLATQFAYIRMRIYFADATGPNQGETLNVHNRKSGLYEYILELNQAGEIIGGEWINTQRTQSVSNHPDFVWVALEPAGGSGQPSGANPHVDPDKVIRLWAKSIGADPNNPPLDIVEPIWKNNWGKFERYSLSIDGDQTGAVFLGKDINVNIKRKQGLFGNVDLLVTLDDIVLKRANLSGEDDFDFNFTPKPGVHRLGLRWRKGQTDIDSRYLRFHVSP